MNQERKEIDVVMLSCTKDKAIFDMTQNAITSLHNSEKDYQFNIYLIESNREIIKFIRETKLQYSGCKIVMPKEDFGYNKFVNIGLTYCKSDKVVVCHNDVLFTKQWFSIISDVMQRFNIDSANPFCPFECKNLGISQKYDAYIGHTVGQHLFSHCLVCKKEVFEKIGKLDEQFSLWYQLEDYCEQIKEFGLTHGVVPSSIIVHLKRNDVINDSENKHHERKAFYKKHIDDIRLRPNKITSSPHKPIYLFFHICCINNYEEVSEEIINSIIKSGLYDQSEKIFYSLLGVPNDDFKNYLGSYSKLELIYRHEDISEVEFPTLIYLENFCKDRDIYVCYLHTKGVSMQTDGLRISWRRRLLQKTIMEYKTCISFLNEGCDVAGCGWKEQQTTFNKDEKMEYISDGRPHFSGNFWWATSDHIKSLPSLINIRQDALSIKQSDFFAYRFCCEYWIGIRRDISVGINGEINREYLLKSYETAKDKLLFISHDCSISGAPRILFEIAEFLKNDFEVAIISGDQGGIDKLYDLPIEHIDFTNEELVHRAIIRHNPTLIYANTIACIEWIQKAIEFNIPYILHIHEKKGILRDYLDKSKKGILERMNHSQIISVSNSCKSDLEEFGIKDATLVHEFINTDRIDAIIAKGDNIDFQKKKYKPLILYIGAIERRKGTDVLIEVARQIPDYEFLCIGRILDDNIFIEGIPNNFSHINHVDNPYYYISLCDLFILPSREDPFPLVVLESLYLNKPTICFSDGVGSAEILDDLGYVIDGKSNSKSLIDFISKFDFKKSRPATEGMVNAHFSNRSNLPKIRDLICKSISKQIPKESDIVVSKDDFFIVTYTNKVKNYCEDIFFESLHNIVGDYPVHIVDNSISKEYSDHLRRKYVHGKGINNFSFYHLDIPIEPMDSLFLRRVSGSANFLRDLFLKSDKKYFLIIESDVIAPVNLLERLSNRILNLPSDWGILGGVYHTVFHDFSKTGIHKVYENDIALSGCTVYKRNVIEQHNFRWSEENKNAFPDHWISYDTKEEYSLWNDYDIQCQHHESWGKSIIEEQF